MSLIFIEPDDGHPYGILRDYLTIESREYLWKKWYPTDSQEPKLSTDEVAILQYTKVPEPERMIGYLIWKISKSKDKASFDFNIESLLECPLLSTSEISGLMSIFQRLNFTKLMFELMGVRFPDTIFHKTMPQMEEFFTALPLLEKCQHYARLSSAFLWTYAVRHFESNVAKDWPVEPDFSSGDELIDTLYLNQNDLYYAEEIRDFIKHPRYIEVANEHPEVTDNIQYTALSTWIDEALVAAKKNIFPLLWNTTTNEDDKFLLESDLDELILRMEHAEYISNYGDEEHWKEYKGLSEENFVLLWDKYVPTLEKNNLADEFERVLKRIYGDDNTIRTVLAASSAGGIPFSVLKFYLTKFPLTQLSSDSKPNDLPPLTVQEAVFWALWERVLIAGKIDSFPEQMEGLKKLLALRLNSIRLGYYSNWENKLWLYGVGRCLVHLGSQLLGWYETFKPLVLSMRKMDSVCLKPNLKPNDIPLTGFVPRTIEFLLGRNWSDERAKVIFQSNNEMGLAFRRAWAEDLIEQLKPRDKKSFKVDESINLAVDDRYKEPSALWRMAYLKAILDLGIKSDSRGHKFYGVLNTIAECDFNEDVRKLASMVQDTINNQRHGVAPGSHKRLLFHAWWWIRYAHVSSLDGVLDQDQARYTRHSEYR